MKTRWLYNKKANVKGILFLVGVSLIISGIWYSQKLVDTLQDKATEYLRFRIKVFENNINNPNLGNNIDFLFNDVIKNADYPVIYTDSNHRPQSWINISPELDNKTWNTFSYKDSLRIYQVLHKMAAENDPIPITYQHKVVLGYYYYGYSPVIYKLRLFPYMAIGAAALFVLIGYLGFSYIKRSEQGFIWVGMAKETAHQLGTPLSSISGWLELLRIDPAMKETAIKEIQNDLVRLNKVANRFSKIGSVPELKKVNLAESVENVVHYFQRRLPQLRKTITIETRINGAVTAMVNEELFEWVLENLIKNSIDSIENDNGKITISSQTNLSHKTAYIDVSDNGKGISSAEKKNIFKPGFSTKKRGWGLGLSLARRIIQEYHNGKLFLKESRPGEGSTFRIVLKALEEESIA